MVASIKPHRDELGLGDGLMLIDGSWAAASDGNSWSHTHPATGEQVASFPVAGPADVDLAMRAARRANERVRVLRKIGDDGNGHPRPVRAGVRGADQGAGAHRRARGREGHLARRRTPPGTSVTGRARPAPSTTWGVVRRQTGDYRGAAEAQEAALGICRDLGDRLGEANAVNQLGPCGG